MTRLFLKTTLAKQVCKVHNLCIPEGAIVQVDMCGTGTAAFRPDEKTPSYPTNVRILILLRYFLVMLL